MSRRERERTMLERIEVRESPIHGKGVFARKRLREGQWIGRFEGDQTTENGTYVLWLIDEDGSEVGIASVSRLSLRTRPILVSFLIPGVTRVIY